MKKVWGFFSSLYLTITLAFIMCAVSAWGSLLAVRYPGFYRSLDAEVLFPRLLSAATGELRFTLWIYILVFLSFIFAVNTSVCTLDRVYNILKKKAPLKSLLPHVVHVGFLIALLGHLAGSVLGFRSQGNVLIKGRVVPVEGSGGVSIRLEDFEARESWDGEIDFLRTRVTVIEGEREVRTGDIMINSPLIYRGIAFYHADHGVMPTGLVIEAAGERASVDFNSSSVLKDGSTLTLGRIYPDFRLDERGEPYSGSREFRNPYVEVVLEDKSGRVSRGFLDIGSPGGIVRAGGRVVRLVDFVVNPFVVVNAGKDSGIWLIIAGSVVLTAGMAALLFLGGEKAEIVRGGGQRTEGKGGPV